MFKPLITATDVVTMKDAPLINALYPSVADRMDPQFAEIYNKYQG
jgi:hypothetical protein